MYTYIHVQYTDERRHNRIPVCTCIYDLNLHKCLHYTKARSQTEFAGRGLNYRERGEQNDENKHRCGHYFVRRIKY